MTKHKVLGVHFMPLYTSSLILVYFVDVLLVIKMLEKIIDQLKSKKKFLLLFYNSRRLFDTLDLVTFMIKYSIKFWDMQILLSTYYYIIINMICLLTTLSEVFF